MKKTYLLMFALMLTMLGYGTPCNAGVFGLEDNQIVTIYASDFSDTDEGRGAGWYVNAGDALQPANSGSGCRIMHNQGAFAEDLVYIAQRDAANGGVAVYGIDDENKLTLEGGKTYHVTLKACRHDRPDVALRVQVLPEEAVDAENGSVIDAEAILAEDFKAITPEKSSKQAISFDLAVTPSENGNFVIRLVPTKENGSFAGYDDAVCFGDVKVKYIPDVEGIVETTALQTALAEAKDTRDAYSDERYAGEDYTALENLIKEVDADMASYSAPSTYAAKTDALNETAKALTDHVALCDEYDQLPQQAFDLWVEKKDSKFVETEYFKNLVVAVNKYCTYGEETTFNEETQEEVTTLVLKDFVKYYTTAELNTAKKELSDVITLASKWLTEGPSTKGWNQITTGYAALHERIRRGVELLKSLGVADDDELIVKANAELGDNDEIAEAIVFRAKQIILADLAKGAESTLFNAEEGEDAPSYDLSVFFKNPNCYGPANSTEVPGWTSVTGNGFAWSSWDGAQNHSTSTPYPEDCDIHAGWHPNPYAMVEQTITDLPAGVYVVTVKCNDNGGSWNTPDDENPGSSTCVYVRTSDNPAIESGAEVDREIDFAAYLTASGDFVNDEGEGLTIEDGELTVGFYYGNTSQAFFEEITSVMLVAPLEGFDYAAAYNGEEPIKEWVDIIVNGDMEEESTECFYVTEQGWGGPYLANITDGIGMDGSRAIMVQSAKNPNNIWDTQFFIRLPYQIPAGTPYRVTFDYKATQEAYYTTQAHGEPGSYIYWRAIGNGSFENYWQTYEMEGVVTSDMSQDGNMMQTIAFNLAEDSRAIQYIFDNIKFEVPASVLESLVWNPAVDPNPYPMFKMGDVNADREVNITDVVLIIEDILEREPQNYNAELADVNYDGWIDVSDVVMVIDAILGKVTLSRGAEPIDRSAYTAFQMDLTIPAGYVLESVSLTDIAKDSHSLAYTMLPDGRCRVVVCSMNNEALPGAWDEVIRLNLRGNGDAQVNIDRAVFVTIDGERHELMMNPTSIAEISTLNSQTSNLYDLQGRKVEKNAKGILIENGRKTVIK